MQFLMKPACCNAMPHGCNRVRKDHWKGMSAMERSAIAQQQVQQVAEKKARQQQQLHEDWQYAKAQADIARNMASQANQVSLECWFHDSSNGRE